jgi:hypothetical protein
MPLASPRYTATPARLAAPAERERANPAAGRLTATTARYTVLWPWYTGGGADGDLGDGPERERAVDGVIGGDWSHEVSAGSCF